MFRAETPQQRAEREFLEALKKLQSLEQLREWKAGKTAQPPVPLDLTIGHLRDQLALCVGAVMTFLRGSVKMVNHLVESWKQSLGRDVHDPHVIAAGVVELLRGPPLTRMDCYETYFIIDRAKREDKKNSVFHRSKNL